MPVRMNKVNRLLQAEISDVVRRQLKDPRLTNWISITEVQTSKDLQHAIILFSTVGDDLIAHRENPVELDERHREITHLLNGAKEAIRQHLRGRIQFKHIPKLEFRYDGGLESADRLTRLIDEGRT